MGRPSGSISGVFFINHLQAGIGDMFSLNRLKLSCECWIQLLLPALPAAMASSDFVAGADFIDWSSDSDQEYQRPLPDSLVKDADAQELRDTPSPVSVEGNDFCHQGEVTVAIVRRVLASLPRNADNVDYSNEAIEATEASTPKPYWFSLSDIEALLFHFDVSEYAETATREALTSSSADCSTFRSRWARGAIPVTIYGSGVHFVVAFNLLLPNMPEVLRRLGVENNNTCAEAKSVRMHLGAPTTCLPTTCSAGDCGPDAVRLVVNVTQALLAFEEQPRTPPNDLPAAPRPTRSRSPVRRPASAAPQPSASPSGLGSATSTPVPSVAPTAVKSVPTHPSLIKGQRNLPWLSRGQSSFRKMEPHGGPLPVPTHSRQSLPADAHRRVLEVKREPATGPSFARPRAPLPLQPRAGFPRPGIDSLTPIPLAEAQKPVLPMGEFHLYRFVVTYATPFHDSTQKFGAGPRALLQGYDNEAFLTFKLFDCSVSARSYLLLGNVLEVAVPKSARVRALPPRSPLPLKLELHGGDVAMHSATYEYILNDVGMPGKDVATIRCLGNVSTPGSEAFALPPLPTTTPVGQIPEVFTGTIILNLEGLVVFDGDVKQKKEFRKSVRLQDAAGAQVDLTVWSAHAMRVYDPAVPYLFRQVEVTCEVWSNGRTQQVPRQFNCWWNTAIEQLG
jgi:hypothetical protein